MALARTVLEWHRRRAWRAAVTRALGTWEQGQPPPWIGPRAHRVVLNPGRRITDPDEAEALGLTVDARRMRQSARRSETR